MVGCSVRSPRFHISLHKLGWSGFASVTCTCACVNAETSKPGFTTCMAFTRSGTHCQSTGSDHRATCVEGFCRQEDVGLLQRLDSFARTHRPQRGLEDGESQGSGHDGCCRGYCVLSSSALMAPSPCTADRHLLLPNGFPCRSPHPIQAGWICVPP